MSIEESMVTPTGDNISNCGYCKTEDNSASYGVWAHQLTCKDYQMFINRGWRRSGAYLYKPNQRDSCCAAYAIRLDVGHFQLEKSHKKIIKKVNKYLHNGRIYHGNNTKTQDTKTLEQLIHMAEQDTDRQFKIVTKRSSLDQDTFDIYYKYQTNIHKDKPEEISVDSFKRFLVDSPLIPEERDDWPVPGLGSFHQKYYLEDQLIAVAVIDILPECVSSVYFMYDPEFAELGLGKYSALREIILTKSLSRYDSSIKYYCMGLYIHTCVKMRYKGQYKPSELLDPETYIWNPLANYLPHFDTYKYVSLSSTGSLAIDAMTASTDTDQPGPGITDWKQLTINDIDGVLAIYKRHMVNASNIRDRHAKESVLQYVAAVGQPLADNMIVAIIH